MILLARKSTKSPEAAKVDDAGVIRLPEMSKRELEALMRSGRVCRMALNDRPRPYIICLDYAYAGGKMYFHLADYGRKMALLEKDPRVSVELDSYNKSRTKYQNATLLGTLARVTDAEEKKRAAASLLKAIRPPAGEKKVAARHGYAALDEGLFASRSSVLVRLDVESYVALKSP